MPFTIDSARAIFPDTQVADVVPAIVASFNQLNAEDRYGLKLLLQGGGTEPAEGGFTQIKVTGKVQTPWFGDKVGINVTWRFLRNSKGKIFFVGIDLLASPQELLNLGLVR